MDKMEAYAECGTSYEGKSCISHSNCLDLEPQAAELVTIKFPNLAKPVQIYSIGTTTESHTGPGTGVLFLGHPTRELRGETCENSNCNRQQQRHF